MCWECGLIVMDSYVSENNDRNTSNYKPSLYFKTTIECIFGEEYITPALERVIRDVKEYKLTNIEEVRQILKYIGRPTYYKHATAI